MFVFLSVLVAVIGLIMYVVNDNKIAELGRIMFFAGLLVFLFGAEQVVALLGR